MVSNLFEDLELFHAANERILFDSPLKVLTVSFSATNGQQWQIEFRGCIGVKYTPSVCASRDEFFIRGEYCRTLVELHESSWVKSVVDAEVEIEESPSDGLRHFAFPSEDGVWEILAHTCQRIQVRDPVALVLDKK